MCTTIPITYFCKDCTINEPDNIIRLMSDINIILVKNNAFKYEKTKLIKYIKFVYKGGHNHCFNDIETTKLNFTKYVIDDNNLQKVLPDLKNKVITFATDNLNEDHKDKFKKIVNDFFTIRNINNVVEKSYKNNTAMFYLYYNTKKLCEDTKYLENYATLLYNELISNNIIYFFIDYLDRNTIFYNICKYYQVPEYVFTKYNKIISEVTGTALGVFIILFLIFLIIIALIYFAVIYLFSFTKNKQ